MNHLRNLSLCLLLAVHTLTGCSKSKADEKQTQGYAPVSISIRQGGNTTPTATINFDYNRSNQLTTISQKQDGGTMTMEFEYGLDGMVSKATVTNFVGATPMVYNYQYKNGKLSAIAYETASLTENLTLTYDAATRSYAMQSEGSSDKLIYQLNETGDLTGFGSNKSDVFKLTYGAGKGVFADFPLQIGHFIPMQLGLVYLYFGSSHEIKKLMVSGLEVSIVATTDSKGYITQSVITDGNNNNKTTSDYTYVLKDLN
ncbi:MAG: hypothetical protein J7578_15005 [Chitinophagaceae bacterium]|nr:hypothetical protein [Chitinophagaceae bacterium]